jgi:two-component system cell cycle response regulator
MEAHHTVLIVDDEPVGRETLEALLIAEGYNLAFAANGSEALTQAAALIPDVILLDVMMPGMDGFEVCCRLRANPGLAEVPVIFVTALDDRDSRLHGIEVGADDFVTKPFDRAELRLRVRTITRLNRYRRLYAERHRLAWTMEHADDGYVLLEADGRIASANPRARLYLGLPDDPESPIPGTFLDWAQRQYHCEPSEAWADWPAPPVVPASRYLVRPETSTARAFWLRVESCAPASPADTGRIVCLRDVTTEMATQRDMRTFHHLLSHKLRTPLNQMLGMFTLLADDTDIMTHAEVVSLARDGLAGVECLQSEIVDILQYLDASDISEVWAGWPLAALAAAVERICLELGVKSPTVLVPDDLDTACIRLSARAVELVLWELFDNAKKFHPTHTPAIEVRVSRTAAGQVHLQVCDDGLTLSPEQLLNAWTPYCQGEKYFTGETQGMGLGLALVAALVWNVGGTCDIANQPEGPGVVAGLLVPLGGQP